MSKEKAKAAKNFSSRMQGARAVWVAVGILALAFLVGVLAPAWYFAGRLVENNTAVRAIGELQQQPSRMQAALNSIQDRLRARGFVRDSIEQLKRATAQFETSTANLKAGGGVSIGGIGGDDDVQNTIDEMNAAWKKYKPALDPVANFTAIPYSDSEREGTQLNMDGRELQQRGDQRRHAGARLHAAARKESRADHHRPAKLLRLAGDRLAFGRAHRRRPRGRAGGARRLPLTGARQTGRGRGGRPPADRRHPLDRARRSLPARRGPQDRNDSLARDRRSCSSANRSPASLSKTCCAIW